jgi:hypothetical protein
MNLDIYEFPGSREIDLDLFLEYRGFRGRAMGIPCGDLLSSEK